MPFSKFTPNIANIKNTNITTTPTFTIPDIELINVVTNNFIDLFYDINLKGLKVLNNLNILTKLKSIDDIEISIKEHTTIIKSSIFQLSLKYAFSSITNPYAIILNRNSIPKNIAKNQSAQSKKLLT